MVSALALVASMIAVEPAIYAPPVPAGGLRASSAPGGLGRTERKIETSLNLPRHAFGEVVAVPEAASEVPAAVPVAAADAAPPEAASGSVMDGPAASAAPAEGTTTAPATDTGPDVPAEKALIDDRRRPGQQKDLPDKIEQDNPGAVNAPPPEAYYEKYDGEGPRGSLALDVAVPDRWRITSGLCKQPDGGKNKGLISLFPNLDNVCHSVSDPYHHNVLKGDKPIPAKDKPGFLKGDDWFFIVNAISDSVVEQRSFPTPAGNQTTESPNQVDTFGFPDSLVLSQTFITGVSLLKGLTAFKPPVVEYRLTLATNINYADVSERRVLRVRPTSPSHRTDAFIGVQEAFVDYHLGRFDNGRYDFVSVRTGIQEFNADFRGFLFIDQQLGIRLFGNRDNNRVQFNLAAFWRLEKDVNSGLNSILRPLRHDFILTANLFRQDFPVVGLTSQASIVYNRNRERSFVEIDRNGFPVRPALLGDLRGHNYDVFYLGYATDGHFGRINMTTQFYAALGHSTNNFLTSRPSRIEAYFGAAELSYDKDWARFRLSGLYASGDKNPYDNKEGGFDAIVENPQFAGADTSYFIRQSIPFAGGGRAIGLNGRNGILPSLRSGNQGQSNFTNPGIILLGAGGDFDLTPTFRLSANVNKLWFDNTSSLAVLRNEGTIPKSIGLDSSISTIYRPKANQNIIFRLSGAVLQPGKGFKDLFAGQGNVKRFYSVLANGILAF